MNKTLLLLGVSFTGILLLSSCGASQVSENTEVSLAESIQNTLSSGKISILENNIDLGEIPIMEGTVDATFTLTNTGDQEMGLYKGETSCMCTNAIVKSDTGIISPTIVMPGHGGGAVRIDQVLQPGESATLIATFDPLAHGPNALGPIKRDVIINTNSKETPRVTFSLQGDVVKEAKAAPIVTKAEETNEAFTFAETSFDFGVVKQSGGKVSHEFTYTYNGKEPITITGVPTSCACTSATASNTSLQQGDTGIVKVVFNPNLHEEPKGRFYKSVSLLTDPKLSTLPEVKVWAEIDLDLGEGAYELSGNHDEETETATSEAYTSITPEKFFAMSTNKDFTLIDTHIPEQEKIQGTDLSIPYTTIGEDARLPKDKNAKIVLYCRSGGMSRAAAYQLAKDGYTNVYDLSGGKNEYDKYLLSQ